MARVTAKKKTKTRLPPEQRLAEIMVTAKEMFIEQGFEQTSMAEIAESMGVVEGTIYRYFKNKQDLLIQILETWYEEELSDYDKLLAGISGVRNRLRFMIWHHLNILRDNPALVLMLVRYVREKSGYRTSTIYKLNQQYTQHIADIAREGINNGEFREDAPLRLIRDMIYGGSEYTTWSLLFKGDASKFNIEQTADDMTDIVYRALANQTSLSSGIESRLHELAARLGKLDQA